MRCVHTWCIIVVACLLGSCGISAPTVQPATTEHTEGTRSASATTVVVPLPSDSPTSLPSSNPTPSPSAAQRPEPSATAAVSASASSTPSASPVQSSAAADRKIITLRAPEAGAAITSPVAVAGQTNFWPFEANLVGQVKDANGNIIGVAPITVQSPGPPDGGPFGGTIEFDGPATEQDGTLEIFETSAKDGSVTTMATLPVHLPPTAQSGLKLDAPEYAQDVTLPLHVALRVTPPADQLNVRLVYSNGTVLQQPIKVVTGNDGVGYAVANMAWNTESAPPPTEPGAAILQVLASDGSVLKEVTLNVLPDDATQQVNVAWTAGEDMIEFQQRVPKTKRIGTAALNELLNGPPDGNLAGATTALPSVGEIVTFGGREPDWGYQVRLLGLTIEHGVATANFSKELRAYGGGSARARAIRQQIERTLQQFPTVQSVVIQIEGESDGVLEP